jgi:prophage antirepressor-like protein
VGYPITTFDVAKLLGHTSSALVEDRYGRLLDEVKRRSEVIEYRVEHFVHQPAFHKRLTALYAKPEPEQVARPCSSKEVAPRSAKA